MSIVKTINPSEMINSKSTVNNCNLVQLLMSHLKPRTCHALIITTHISFLQHAIQLKRTINDNEQGPNFKGTNCDYVNEIKATVTCRNKLLLEVNEM